MRKTILTLVCDVCGKESKPITKSGNPKVPQKGDPKYGWFNLDLNQHAINEHYKDYCSSDCVKKELDSLL